MDGVGIGNFRSRNDRWNVQITLRSGCGADAD